MSYAVTNLPADNSTLYVLPGQYNGNLNGIFWDLGGRTNTMLAYGAIWVDSMDCPGFLVSNGTLYVRGLYYEYDDLNNDYGGFDLRTNCTLYLSDSYVSRLAAREGSTLYLGPEVLFDELFTASSGHIFTHTGLTNQILRAWPNLDTDKTDSIVTNTLWVVPNGTGSGVAPYSPLGTLTGAFALATTGDWVIHMAPGFYGNTPAAWNGAGTCHLVGYGATLTGENWQVLQANAGELHLYGVCVSNVNNAADQHGLRFSANAYLHDASVFSTYPNNSFLDNGGVLYIGPDARYTTDRIGLDSIYAMPSAQGLYGLADLYQSNALFIGKGDDTTARTAAYNMGGQNLTNVGNIAIGGAASPYYSLVGYGASWILVNLAPEITLADTWPPTDDDWIISGDGDKFSIYQEGDVAKTSRLVIDVSGDLWITNALHAKQPVTSHTDAAVVLTDAQCRGALHINGDDDRLDFTLPPAEQGLVVSFANLLYAQLITVTPAAGDILVLNNGTALAAGNSADSSGAVDDKGTFIAVDGTYWMLFSEQNVWVDGGAP
jgi:hypothetical protein